MRRLSLFLFIALTAVSCGSNFKGKSPVREFTANGLTSLKSVSELNDSCSGESFDYYGDRMYLDSCVFTLPADLAGNEIALKIAANANMALVSRYIISASDIGSRIKENGGEWYVETDALREQLPLLFEDNEIISTVNKMLDLLEEEKLDDVKALFVPLNESFSEKYRFITEKELSEVEETFWGIYDKSKIVPDINSIQRKRIESSLGQVDSVSFKMLRQKRLSSSSLDEYAIYAIEENRYSGLGDPNTLEAFGGIIEAREYTRYLAEVYFNWRPVTQVYYFGSSSDSVIPNVYYDAVRNICLQTITRHIAENPDDLLAKALAMNLISQQALRRSGGIYGNEAEYELLNYKTAYFLPKEEN